MDSIITSFKTILLSVKRNNINMNCSRLWVSLYLYSGSNHVHGVGEGGGCSCSHRSRHGLQEEVWTVRWSQSGELLWRERERERERENFTVTVHVQWNSGGGAFLIHTNSGVPCSNLHTHIIHWRLHYYAIQYTIQYNRLYTMQYTVHNMLYNSTQRTHDKTTDLHKFKHCVCET